MMKEPRKRKKMARKCVIKKKKRMATHDKSGWRDGEPDMVAFEGVMAQR